jgi:hypothetical protein
MQDGQMPIDVDTMERHLQSDDAVAVLLRGHLWVEVALTDLIQAELEFPEVWEDVDRLSFPSKVALATAQGNLMSFDAFSRLNRVRNRLAHDPRFEIDRATALHLAEAVATDFGDSGVPYDIEFSLHTQDNESVAALLRESIVTLLIYVARATTEALQIKTSRVKDQLQRAREFHEKSHEN